MHSYIQECLIFNTSALQFKCSINLIWIYAGLPLNLCYLNDKALWILTELYFLQKVFKFCFSFAYKNACITGFIYFLRRKQSLNLLLQPIRFIRRLTFRRWKYDVALSYNINIIYEIFM